MGSTELTGMIVFFRYVWFFSLGVLNVGLVTCRGGVGVKSSHAASFFRSLSSKYCVQFNTFCVISFTALTRLTGAVARTDTCVQRRA